MDDVGYHLRSDPAITNSAYDPAEVASWLGAWSVQQRNLYVMPKPGSNMASCLKPVVYLPVDHPTEARALSRLMLLSLAAADTDEHARGWLLAAEALITRRLREASRSLGPRAGVLAPFATGEEVVHATLVAFYGRLAARPFLGGQRTDDAARLLLSCWFGEEGEPPDLGRKIIEDPAVRSAERAAPGGGAETRRRIREAALAELADAEAPDYFGFLTAANVARGQPFSREALGQQFPRPGTKRAFEHRLLIDLLLREVGSRARRLQAEPFDDEAALDETDDELKAGYEAWLLRPYLRGPLVGSDVQAFWRIDQILLASSDQADTLGWEERRRLDQVFGDPRQAALFVAFQGHILMAKYMDPPCHFGDLRALLDAGLEARDA